MTRCERSERRAHSKNGAWLSLAGKKRRREYSSPVEPGTKREGTLLSPTIVRRGLRRRLKSAPAGCLVVVGAREATHRWRCRSRVRGRPPRL